MHITYTCGLLTAANEQRHGFIKLRGVRADDEVHLMKDAGLVSATFTGDKQGSFACINRVLPAGQAFLRLHNCGCPGNHLSPVVAMSGSQTGILQKWKNKFGSSFIGMLPRGSRREEELEQQM